MENLIKTITKNNFKVTKETVKAIEFENLQNNEVVYLVTNKEITIVLNPKIVVGNEDLEEKSFGKLHNTAFKQFPKRKNKGKNPITYGYSFKFQSDAELSVFLSELNHAQSQELC
jgi:hypothetical protein